MSSYSGYSSIKTKILNRLARNTSEIKTLIPEWVNDTIDEVCDDNNWWFMKTTSHYPVTSSDDPAQYLLAGRVKEVDKVYILIATSTEDAFVELEELSFDDALRIYSPNPTRARPEAVVIENVTMTVFPPPNQNYDIYVVSWNRFLRISDDGDDPTENFLTMNKEKMVIAGALAKGFAYLQEYDDSQFWEGKFDKYMKQLRREHNSRILAGEITLIPKTGKGSTAKTELMRLGSGYPLKGYS